MAVFLSVGIPVLRAQEITVRNDVDFSFMDPALITNSNDYTIAATFTVTQI
jgi:hypothetical protein